MQPVDLTYELKNDNLLLKWNKNSIGKLPDFYKVYGSDEIEGFVPDKKNLISASKDSSFNIHYYQGEAPKTFYRVTACSYDGQESLPSKFLSLPYPYLFSSIDSIVPDKEFKLDLALNEKYRAIFCYKEDTVIYRSWIEYNTIPYWLKSSKGSLVEGIVDYDLSRRMIFVDSLSQISIRVVNDSGYNKSYSFKLTTTEKNRAPSIVLNDSIATFSKPFHSFISTDDGDASYGDSNDLRVLNMPSWLNYTMGNDTIFLDGKPEVQGAENNLITITATDSKGVSVTKNFKVDILLPNSTIAYIVPNPVNENPSVYLNLSSESLIKIDLYNSSGVRLQSISDSRVGAGITQIPFTTSSLKPNIYILKFTIVYIKSKKTEVFGIKFIKM